MDTNTTKLRRGLREAGLSNQVISAAWPRWWNESLSTSPSAHAELRFALARKLGLEPKSLLGERVEFIWKDRARFKHLGAETEVEQRILSSFAMSVGRILSRGIPDGVGFYGVSAEKVRAHILQTNSYVTLPALVAACWSAGVPIVHLKVFPLEIKAMHAMVVGEAKAGAIMLGRDASYPSILAFTLAHEIAHLALGHVRSGNALIDVEDPSLVSERDEEEQAADTYALALLTGFPKLEITTDLKTYDAPTLANTVLKAAPKYHIEPGTLALCVGHQQKNWAVVMSALSFIYPKKVDIWKAINRLAYEEIEWQSLVEDDQDFIHELLSLDDA